jgi:hypothetical protein
MQLTVCSSLEALGEKLVTEGPHKVEGTPRRVRGLLGGIYVFDTTEAKFVWEHPYCPSLVFSLISVLSQIKATPLHHRSHILETLPLTR